MNSKRFLIHFSFFIIASCFSVSVHAQKYFFQHYDIENGLLQSQVTSITQDHSNQIWISTLGGISCFDSKQFTSFTVEDGLPDNDSFGLSSDNEGRIWWGSSKGITAFDQNSLKNYPFKYRTDPRLVRSVLADNHNTKWALAGHYLFKLNDGQLVRQTVVSDSEYVSAIQVNQKREIYAAIEKKGIYKFENNTWTPVLKLDEKHASEIEGINNFIFDTTNPGQIFFITDKQLYCYDNGLLKAIDPPLFKKNHFDLTCLSLDNENGIWIGTGSGACLYKNHTLNFFNEDNGFTNSPIFCIYKAADGHIWFGTDGSGLYQFINNNFLIYDKSQGLNNNVVMGLTKSKENGIYISTYSRALFRYKNNKISEVKFLNNQLENNKIDCLFEDSKENLWIGTDFSGLWKKTGEAMTKILPKVHTYFGAALAIQEDSNNVLWVAATGGCFYIKDNQLIKVTGINQYCNSILEIGKDSILVGTEAGVKLIKNKQYDSNYLPGCPKVLILSLQRYKHFVFAGTNDRGVFVWSSGSRSYQNITTKQGLYSNSIFSILIVNDQLWAGTGRGVNKFSINNKNNHLKISLLPLSSVLCECNENAILRLNNNMWIGTTHGINVYPINDDNITTLAPHAVIENIQSYTNDLKGSWYSYHNGYKLLQDLSLPAAESHISIKFQAVEYNDPKTYYQYKLEGLDKDYSRAVQNNFVDYPSLPPATYVFKVRAVTSNGIAGIPVSYTFTVVPAFYQTIIFKIAVILFLLFILISIFFYKTYLDRRKNIFINQLRLIEQENVRRQTAEDFHDDLGNKLTRINMLSELLDKKISGQLTDQKKIIQQIRAGVTEMYSGTKNILWALNPMNDNLGEIISEVKKISESLFDSTNISFTVLSYQQDLNQLKVPLGYSHNMMLIFKELITNILKHSNADEVTFSIEATSYNQVCFKITDNGEGYQINNAFPGNGLRNIQNRSKKLNGEIITSSQPGKGTITKLIITVP